MSEKTRQLPVRGSPRWARVRLAALLLFVAAAAVGLRVLTQGKLEPRAALALLRSVQDQVWAVPAFALLYVSLTAAFAPAVLFHMVAGAAWGFGWGMVVNTLACSGAAMAQFAVARRLGRARVAGLLERYRLNRFDALAEREGLRAAISVRALPIPFVVVATAAGVSRLRARDFFLGTLIGTLPINAVYTYFAAALVEGVAGVERQVFVNVAIAAALLVLVSYGPRVWTWLRARR